LSDKTFCSFAQRKLVLLMQPVIKFNLIFITTIYSAGTIILKTLIFCSHKCLMMGHTKIRSEESSFRCAIVLNVDWTGCSKFGITTTCSRESEHASDMFSLVVRHC